MSPDRRRLERGVTLAEILVVSAVVAAMAGGLTMVLADAGGRIWTRTDGQLTALNGAQRALDRLTQDLYSARQPVTCRADGSLSFTTMVRDATTQQLIAGPVVTYSCVGCNNPAAPGTLTKVEGVGGPPQVMASGLASFTCQPVGLVSLVRITLTSQENTWQGPFTHTLESQVWVRNP